MLVKSQTVSDYEGFQKIIKNLEDKGESAVLIISGSRDETGKSWCPDCVKGIFFFFVNNKPFYGKCFCYKKLSLQIAKCDILEVLMFFFIVP